MEFNDLTESQREELTIAGMDLMRVVTEVWGPEKGMALWDEIANSVGTDFKGAIFFTMLTGAHIGDVRVLSAVKVDQNSKAIEFIKLVRAATGCGLKEAKDVWDRIKIPGAKPEKLVLLDKRQRKQLISALRDLGADVG